MDKFLWKQVVSFSPSLKNIFSRVFIVDPIKIHCTYDSAKNYIENEIKLKWVHKLESGLSNSISMEFSTKGIKLTNFFTNASLAFSVLANKFYDDIFSNLLVDKSYNNSVESLKHLCANYEEFTEKNKNQVLNNNDDQLNLYMTSIFKSIIIPHKTVKNALSSISDIFTSISMVYFIKLLFIYSFLRMKI